MPRVHQILTDTPMPPFGVAESLMPDQKGPDLFAFWLVSHHDTEIWRAREFWRTAVLRECLPSADANLDFVALGELLQ